MRVLLHQRILAHYREPIYRLLAQQSSYSFFFVAGQGLKNDPRPIMPGTLPGRMFHNLYIRFPPGKWICWQCGLISWLLFHPFDVLIMLPEPYNLTSWFLPVIAKIRRKPTIAWTIYNYTHESGIKLLLRFLLLRPHRALLLYSKTGNDFLCRHGFEPRQLHVVNNSLDYDLQQKTLASIRLQDIEANRLSIAKKISVTTRFLVHISRLIPDKHLDQLFKALAALIHDACDIHLILIGNGPLRGDLETLAGDLQIASHIHFTGALYDEAQIGLHISSADLAVFPGNGGLPIIHCMTYGVPVIIHSNESSTQTPEVEAVINGSTGDRYTEFDLQSLSHCIRCWLYDKRDRSAVRQACMDMVRSSYTPAYQLEVISQAIRYVTSR